MCSQFVYVCNGPYSAELIKGKINMLIKLIKTDGIVFPLTSHPAKKKLANISTAIGQK